MCARSDSENAALDDWGQARIPLQRALALAEPEGYVRLFADEGAPLAQLLERAASVKGLTHVDLNFPNHMRDGVSGLSASI